jgi:hypothetical protein
MATRIDITLEQLHHLQARVDRQNLAAQDWPVVAGLVSMLIARTEARQERLRAKAAQQAAQQQDKQAVGDAATEESSKPALEDEPAPGGAGPGEPRPTDSREPDPPKGHGRNGADAFAHATTHLHCLAAGIIGAPHLESESRSPWSGSGLMGSPSEALSSSAPAASCAQA